jgi:hypothetical protein
MKLVALLSYPTAAAVHELHVPVNRGIDLNK